MKEVDRMKVLVSILREWWIEAGNPRIQAVHLWVGALSGVDTERLSKAFETQKVATFLDRADLIIEEIPFLAFCKNCQQEYQPEIKQRYCCPICAHPLHEVRSGRELKIGDIQCFPQKTRGMSCT
jgi:hydrogenase nickel incorporation protein HypA/HybF